MYGIRKKVKFITFGFSTTNNNKNKNSNAEISIQNYSVNKI